MQVLITGAAGMVGSRLARSLLSDPPAGLAGLALVDVVPPRLPEGAAVPVAAGGSTSPTRRRSRPGWRRGRT